jgi:DNA-directed RNA polymerase specialized sigma24 family protein
LEEALAVPAGPPVDLLAVDDVLTALSAFDARKAQIVEFRIFGGLSVQETASVLKISTDTVTRDMQLATAWMRRELSGRRIREG